MELKDVLSKIETFRSQLDTLEIPEGATKKFEKAFDKVLNSLEGFDVIAGKGIESLADTKDLEKAWKKVLSDLNNLEVVFRSLDASNIFPKTVIDNIKKAESALEAYNKKLTGAKESDAYKSKFKEREQALNKETILTKQLEDARNKQIKAEGQYQAKQAEWSEEKQKEYAAQQKAIKSAEAELDNYNKKVERNSKKIKQLQKEGYITQSGTVAKKRRDEVEKMTESPEKANAQKKLEQAEAALAEAQRLKNAKADYDGMVRGAKDAAESNEKLKKEVDEAESNFKKLTGEVTSYDKQVKQAATDSQKLDSELKNIATDEAKDEWQALVAVVKAFTGIDLDESVQDVQEIKQALDNYRTEEIDKLPQIFEELKEKLGETAPAAGKVSEAVEEVGESARVATEAAAEIERLRKQVLDFFSITNSIQLFKRAITSAMNTVKELDATMTEAAVVTEFDVSDMWEKLPDYSAEAQKLGVSINGMYQATTLYYQQGLNANKAMEVGVETMKMAKIAGMDNAQATEAMTAALRGFNMELNETSAARVNDVYSQLAAVTAADTEQIATAMSKTASIAAAANMEFESTAAFLAQIIETTQEAPETAGTALKTIIARFAEVKQLREQGLSSGQDEEGEIIDVNKIQTALRTVGISMEGFFAGTEGLDDVLLKLSEKWGSLDFETQHYIATMAAGSRQQSRFIAMMSDYGRMTELVASAQNSAGASQKQFEKTQESLATSLTKLSNAWDEFLMGLANNEVLKAGVDTLTFILESINKITDAISGGNGLIKSLTSLIGVIGALKLGKSVFDSTGFGNALGKLTGRSEASKETITETRNDDGSIVRTIVKEPLKDGEQAGQQAGQGFINGFKKMISAEAKGMRLESLFTTGPAADVSKTVIPAKKVTGKIDDKLSRARNNKIQKKHEARAGKDLKNVAKTDGKTGYLAKIANINSNLTSKDGAIWDLDIAAVSQAYDKVIAENGTLEEAVEAANIAVREQGGTLMDSEQAAQMAAEQTNGLALNMGALGGAAMGLSGALGLIAAGLEEIGLEEFAGPASVLASTFMVLGTVMTTLSSIAPMLGMSFTTAGIQITKAGVTSQLAWWWVFAIIAAVALLAVGIAALFKPKDDGLEKQLESVNNQIEQMNTAADEAASSLDKLTEARDELADMQNVFKGLVKGTTEWRKALVESNAKVLELLNTYPELANYISTDENGLMSIRSIGWNEIVEKQTNAMVSSQASAAALQAKKVSLERQQIMSDSSLTSLQKQAKLTELSVREDTQMQAYYTAAIATDKELANSAYAQSAMNVLSYDDADELKQEIASEEMQKADKDDFSDSQKESLKKSYAELTGKTTEEVSKLIEDGLTYEDINTAVAADKITKKKAEDMKKISTAVSRANKEDQKILEKLFTKDGKGLKKSDANAIWNSLSGYEGSTEERLASYLSEKGITLEQDQLEGLVNALNNVTEAFGETGEIVKTLEGYGLSNNEAIKELVTGMEYGAGYELANKLGGLVAEGATTAEVEELVKTISGALSGLGDDEEARDSALAYLADTNWDSKESIADMVEFLKGFDGLDDDILEGLGDNIVELSNAVSENTAAQLQEKSWALQDIKDKILSGEISQTSLSSDDVELLKNSDFNEKDFAKTGTDTWVYTGGDLYNDIAEKYNKTKKDKSDKAEEVEKDYNTAWNWNNLKAFGSSETFAQAMDRVKNFTLKDSEMINMEATYAQWGSDWEQYKKDNGLTYVDPYFEAAHYTEWAYDTGKPDTGMSEEEAEKINNKFIGEVNEVHLLYTQAAIAIGETPNKDLTVYEKLEKLKEWHEQYGDIQAFKTAYINAAKEAGGEVLTNTNLTTSEIGYQKFEDPEVQEKYSKTRSAALEQRVKATGGSVFKDDITNAIPTEELKKFTDAINALASDIAVTATKTKKFAENMSDLADALSGNKNTPEYGKALEQAKANVKDYFGVTDKEIEGMSEELYAQLAKGDPKALDKMQKHIGEKLFGSAEAFENALNNIKPTIETTYDAEGLVGLAKALGVVAEDFTGELTTEALQELSTKLSALEVGIAFQYDQASGQVTGAVTTSIDRSGLYEPYRPKAPKASKFQNTLDKQYNTYEKINALLRERERIERRYDKLLESRDVSGKKLLENTQEQLANLKKEEEYQKGLQAAKKAEIQDLLKKNATTAKRYGVSFDYNSGAISVNWAKLNAERNATRGEKGLDLISSLEGLRDQWDEAGIELENIEDAVDEIRNKGREDYLSFEQKVRDALIDSRQKEVDALNEINDSINDANSKMLESMQRQIDEYRQTRDNEKTEQDIEDKQRRLAYLQQDTSGANALEIMRLEKEIGEAQESYTDQLIDQKISELQKQNDEAAEQRERQIQLMEANNKLDEESGRIWDEVHRLIREGRDENKALNWESELANLLKQFAGFEAMSGTEKKDWTEETSKEAAEAYKGLDTSYAEKGEKVTFTEGSGRQVEGTSNGEGKVTTDSGLVYTNVHYNEKGNLVTDYTTEEAQAVYDEYLNRNKKGYIASLPRKTGLTKAQIKNLQRGLNALRADGVISFSKALSVDGVYGKNTKAAVKALQKKIGSSADGVWGKNTYDKFHGSGFTAYKTGGLADFTGPAWLDGTKARPEYVLNADQTKAFFQLVDVLSGLERTPTNSTQNNGDINLDIDINVETINDTADLDMISSYIEEKIVSSANYRNNNVVGRSR